MKFESDTEIDRLLRRHARRKAAASSLAAESVRAAGDEGAAARNVGGAHLDADEMNAFAEGAVPERLRTRYVAHLADCDDCRSLVTRLTLAAGVGVEARARRERSAPAVTRSWRDWLAAIFAPPVLRYGVPALALMAVVVIALIAMRERRQQQPDLIAQNERTQNSSVRPQITQDEQQSQTNATGMAPAPFEETAPGANSGAGVNNQRPSDNAAAETATTQQKEIDAKKDAIAQQREEKLATQARDYGGLLGSRTSDRSDSDEALTLPKPTPLPAPPAATEPVAKAPAAEDRQLAREQETAKAAGAAEQNRATAPTTVGRNSNYAIDGVESGARTETRPAPENSPRAGATTSARRARAAKTQTSGEASGGKGKDERAVETRNAGGRSFRRQGGAWVDTAYTSSRSVVNVARGSEQFRALIADEPGIRAIADQLGGTLILVWKNRAYRIY